MKLKKIILAVSLLLCTALILCSCFKLPAGGGNKPTDAPATKETTPEQTTPEPTTTPEQAAVGVYELFAISYEGILVEPMAFDMDSTIELKEDMTGIVSSNIGTGKVDWSINGNIITLTDSGEPIDLELDGKILTLDYGEGSLGFFAKSDADLSGYTVLTAEEFFDLYYYEENFEEYVDVSPEDTIEEDDDFYTVRFGFSLLTDKDIEDGWYYSYSTGTDDVVPEYHWPIASGRHTAGSFGIVVYNDSDNMTEDFNSRFQGVVVFNEPFEFDPDKVFDESYISDLMSKNADMDVFEMTPLFANPGQTLEGSGSQAYSADARIVGKDEGGYLSGMFDMSEDAYKSLMDHDSDKVMTVYFTFGNGKLYIADAHEFFDYFCSDYE
ncbi:MAG: hypothetical protein IKR67_04385 [Lachnospiraceae bacterium]|nr:hypothetical protein [Lachnospiraceae bacterium]